MEQIDNLKELINQGDVDTAIKQLDQLLQDSSLLFTGKCLPKERRLEAGTGQLPVCHRDQSGQSCRSGQEDGNRYPQLLPQGYVQSIKEMYNQ